MEEASRRGLYARLEEVLGDEHAATLMGYLPQTTKLATTADVAGLESRMDRLGQRMDRLEQRMDRLDDRLHDLHGALREQTRTFVVASISTMVALAAAAFSAGILI